ncbi:Protein of unknown function [Bacillus cereus]|nr:Protein of unknown function [Bacillus cereus]
MNFWFLFAGNKDVSIPLSSTGIG